MNAIVVFVHSFYFILFILVIIVSSVELAFISFSYSASQLSINCIIEENRSRTTCERRKVMMMKHKGNKER